VMTQNILTKNVFFIHIAMKLIKLEHFIDYSKFIDYKECLYKETLERKEKLEFVRYYINEVYSNEAYFTEFVKTFELSSEYYKILTTKSIEEISILSSKKIRVLEEFFLILRKYIID